MNRREPGRNDFPVSEPCLDAAKFGCAPDAAAFARISSGAGARLAADQRLALEWMLRNSWVASAVIPAPTTRELRELVRAVDLVCTATETAALASLDPAQDFRRELRHV